MGTRTVLIANDPRAYRETIAVAIGMLCPDARIIVADPEKVDEFVTTYHPQVVLCSHLTPMIEAHVPTWAILYPDGSENALLHMDGQRSRVPNIELNGIVRLVDDANGAPSA
jgi:hypothetical protein